MSFLSHFAFQLSQSSKKAHYPVLVIVNNNRELYQLKQLIQFFEPTLTVLIFPDWEILPYERLSPSAISVNQRLDTLNRLIHYKKGIVITTLKALSQRLAPKDYINAYTFDFTVGEKINTTLLQTKLADCGYQRISTVTLPGEFAIRGEVIDIFPLNSTLPFRIQVNVNTIEQLYYFDPNTQAHHDILERIQITPKREFLLSEDSVHRFRQQGTQHLGQYFLNSTINKQLSHTTHVAGIEYYLPLFFETTHILFDYLPRHTHWTSALSLEKALDSDWDDINTRYQSLSHDREWPILHPSLLYQTPYMVLEHLGLFKKLSFDYSNVTTLPDLYENHNDHPPQKLQHFLKTQIHCDTKVLFCTGQLSHQASFLKQLSTIGINASVTQDWQSFLESKNLYQYSITPIKQGFFAQSLNLLVIPDTAIYPIIGIIPSKAPSLKNVSQSKTAFNDLGQLVIGDFVVHADHGIGRYLGLESIKVREQTGEFIMLGYAEGSKLYVPIQDIQQISRYTGQNDPTVNNLNNSHWKKTKTKVLTQLKDTAAELLQLYAKRAEAKGESFSPPNQDYLAFEAAFAFEETPDQTKATVDIIKDLCSTKPMDRLICGDVGFGKTEMAMRAAFLAVQSGKQVAVLAPTTLLVDQHYRNFKERFANWPITLNWLSRFRNAADSRSVLKDMATGATDIIIGTHTLLSKKMTFNDLGLLIIDEEHHFGVQQKERLIMLKQHIHVLTLTATPIPRTLQTSLAGLRELSLITTPPKDRLAIKSFVLQRDTHIIKEAILRELSRGGQVYFVYNRIASLSRITREIQKLVPEARIGIAHSQLSEAELESCMNAFQQQHYNVLICTSIIETGLDIPTVNTLIVDRADHFGLAQLHQLRGRVGRSHHQAYAYFLISETSQVTNDAQKRLKALATFNQLGSGFNLATQDLDIRGAGELLGDRQSGAVKGVGFSLYMELLQKTMDAMKQGQSLENVEDATRRISVDLKIPAFIPSSYLPDIALRLQYYKRIDIATDEEQLTHIQMELLDQYGLFPLEMNHLFAITALKQTAYSIGIAKIESNNQGGRIEFYEHTIIKPQMIMELIQRSPDTFKLMPHPKSTYPYLRFVWPKEATNIQRIQQINDIIKLLKD